MRKAERYLREHYHPVQSPASTPRAGLAAAGGAAAGRTAICQVCKYPCLMVKRLSGWLASLCCGCLGLSEICVPVRAQPSPAAAAPPASETTPASAVTPAPAQQAAVEPPAGPSGAAAAEPDAAPATAGAPATDAPAEQAAPAQPRPLPDIPPCALDLPREHVVNPEDVSRVERNLEVYRQRERKIQATGQVQHSCIEWSNMEVWWCKAVHVCRPQCVTDAAAGHLCRFCICLHCAFNSTVARCP